MSEGYPLFFLFYCVNVCYMYTSPSVALRVSNVGRRNGASHGFEWFMDWVSQLTLLAILEDIK